MHSVNSKLVSKFKAHLFNFVSFYYLTCFAFIFKISKIQWQIAYEHVKHVLSVSLSLRRKHYWSYLSCTP